MRKLLLFLGLLAFICNPAMAGKNANGAMVVHTDDRITYTFFAPPDYCLEYLTYDPGDDCFALNPSSGFIDPTFLLGAVVYYVAAWAPGATPGVTVVFFGHDHNFALGFIGGWGLCGPPNSLEIPDGGWPNDPIAGNSVAFGSPIAGDLVFPFYWLGVYADVGNYIGPRINQTGGYAGFVSDDNPGVLDECFLFGTCRWLPEEGFNDCPIPMEFSACCFPDGSCILTQTEEECFALGGYIWCLDDTCDPNPCPQPGACCFEDGFCEYIVEDLCQGYLFMPEDDCEPNPCPQPEAVCCFENGDCAIMTEDECAAAMGDWRPDLGDSCDPNPCPPPPPPEGACCDGPVCYIATQEDCEANGDMYMGDDVPCDPNPCPVPVENSTWGQIKANFK
jgi:hypothetical protein